jgi:hypothetical protein
MRVLLILIVLLSVGGYFLNVRKNAWGFFLWIITNTFWCIRNYQIGENAQAGLFLFYLIVTIYGFFKWLSDDKEEKRRIFLTKHQPTHIRALVIAFNSRQFENFIIDNHLSMMEYRYVKNEETLKGWGSIGIIILDGWHDRADSEQIIEEVNYMINSSKAYIISGRL